MAFSSADFREIAQKIMLEPLNMFGYGIDLI
jgi:hypothetical protein